MTSRIQNMLNQAASTPTELLKYNKMRSKHHNILLFAVEGDDDVTFYQTICERLSFHQEYKFLVLYGKDKVLGLHDTLINSVSAANKNLIKYFIDYDFDGLKGSDKTDALYYTPTYSIENILVGENVLKKTLISKFKCVGDDDDDINQAINLYRSRLNEFNIMIKDVNQKIFFTRKNKLKGFSINKDLVKKMLHITLDKVEKKNLSECDVDRLLGFDSIPHYNHLEEDFNVLDPCKNWRGKFLYEFFLKFIELLAEDRTSDAPTIFSRKKKGVTFQAGVCHIQELAMFAEIPNCLNQFITQSSIENFSI